MVPEQLSAEKNAKSDDKLRQKKRKEFNKIITVI